MKKTEREAKPRAVTGGFCREEGCTPRVKRSEKAPDGKYS